jgi:hypothetical protein
MMFRYRLQICLVFLAQMIVLIGFRIAATAQELNPALVVPSANANEPSLFGREGEALLAPMELLAKDSGMLNNLFSHQWVQMGEGGTVRGRVLTLVGDDTLSVSGTQVSLIQRGRVIASTASRSDGSFSLDGMQTGYYSIVAEADNSFAAFGLVVLDPEAGAHLPSSVDIRVVRPRGDSLRRILSVDMPPMALSGSLGGMVRDPLVGKREFAKSHRILADATGKVVGRISPLAAAAEAADMSQMSVMLLQEGMEISRSKVSVDGRFTFEKVLPGCYGFVAAGNRGMAAVAFCVVSEDALAKRPSAPARSWRPVSLQELASPSLNVELADGADVLAIQESLTPEEEAVEEEIEEAAWMQPPMGGNMFGAGTVIGGGGGGTLGGEWLGDLLGLGALAAMAAVIADSDDDNQSNVVSPITQ